MIWTVIHIIDIILWAITAVSVAYILFYALCSLFSKKDKSAKTPAGESAPQSTFLVLYPSYKEDAVIKETAKKFLRQTYPADKYTLLVIADQMQDSTVEYLKALPARVLVPHFDKSSKAKSMQFAISDTEQRGENYDYVVILDADNVVEPDFLTTLNEECHKGYKAIQCHRCAKNADNDVAVMDGVSEEINNTLFRKAHNTIGLSSALIGSGMCFTYQWFADSVKKLTTAGEDRELEVLLLKEKIHIHYAAHIPVYDEKVSCVDNFQRQRLRWMTAQVQSFLTMLPQTPKALITGNINFLDKWLQQALIPRSILIFLTFAMAVVMTLVSWRWGLKWIALFLLTCLALFIAMPPQMRTAAILKKATALPKMVWRMVRNILKIDHKNTDFIHTTHNKTEE